MIFAGVALALLPRQRLSSSSSGRAKIVLVPAALPHDGLFFRTSILSTVSIMTMATTEASPFTAGTSAPEGVRTYTLGDSKLPLVVEPVQEGIVLEEWNTTNREW